jgi:hypothetical protein
MYQCTFELNDKPMSIFTVGTFSCNAFSGLSPYINKKANVCLANVGAIPPSTYYIIDRESGGILGSFWDTIKGHINWFSLYAIDKIIDDSTYCDEVKRGNFRLHPKGVYGISKGCITINNHGDFNHLRSILKGAEPTLIPGSKINAYGKVVVR